MSQLRSAGHAASLIALNEAAEVMLLMQWQDEVRTASPMSARRESGALHAPLEASGTGGVTPTTQVVDAPARTDANALSLPILEGTGRNKSTRGKKEQHKCKHCGFVAVSRYMIRKHRRQSHYTSSIGVKCGYKKCDFRCKKRVDLDVHFKEKHGGKRPFPCQVPGCKFAAKFMSALNAHMVVHSGVKRFACAHCGKRFGKKCNMKEHEQRHFKNFECPNGCGKRFSGKRELNYHLKLAKNKCPMAGKAE